MSHYLHPNYASRSHSEDQSYQSTRSGGSRSSSRPRYRHQQQQGEEGSHNSHNRAYYSSGSSEGNETGLVSGTESEGEYSGSASRMLPHTSTRMTTTKNNAGLHMYPADAAAARHTTRPDPTPAVATSTSSGKPKKSARDLMRLQAGKANLDGTGSSTYTTSTATARSRASRTEVDKLRFHINTSRRNTAANANSSAVAITPSPSHRRVRSNPQERYDDYNDPEVEPLPSPEPSPPSPPPGLRGSRSADYESGGEGLGDRSKSPHMHSAAAAAIAPSRQARLQRHVQRQKELGQEGQSKKSVYFGQDQSQQQQQQQQQQTPASRAIHPSRSQESDASAPSRRDFTMLASSNPATALNVTRDGPHATIVKLRRQLDDTLAQNERSKTALARSDAVILELRKDLRDASSRLAKSEGERELLDRRAAELEEDLSTSQRDLHELRVTAQARTKELEMISDEVGRANQRDAVLGELQLKLDRAEAQILTADMRNKQLEEDYRRDREEWEMALARKEDEIDQCRAELGGEVSNRKDAEQFWKQSANTREERMRELEGEIGRLSNMLRETNDREAAIQSEREADREALAEVDELRSDLDEAAKVLDDTRNALNEALDELAKVRKDKDRAECDRDFVREELDILTTKLEQETGEKNQLAKERNELRAENASLRSRRGLANFNENLATSEAKVGELTRQLSSAKEEAKQLRARLGTVEAQAAGAPDKASLVRSQMEKAEVGTAKRELEAQNARLERKLERIQSERDDLKQCLDDAMNELEIADAEAKDVFEYKKRNAELDDKVKNLDNLIIQRDTEVNALKQQIALLEEELLQSSAVASSSRGGFGESVQPPANSRARIETKRRASESKFRALMGQVTNSIDKRSRDPDGMGAVRSIPLDSDGDSSNTDDDRSNAGLLYRGRVEELKVKLKTTEETLEITQRELDEMRQQVSSATYGADGIARSKSMDAADAATSTGGRDLARELNMEKARATSLQQQLSSANDAVRVRDESNADLRKSLQEAVSLLKPLKEHVARAEGEKEEMKRELARSKQRIGDLEKEIASRSTYCTNNESPSTVLRLRQKEQEVERLEKEIKNMEEALFDAQSQLSDAQERLARTATRGISDESSTSSSRPLAQASNQSTNENSDANIRIQLQRTQNDLEDRRKSEELFKQRLERAQEQLQAKTRDQEELIRLRQTVKDTDQRVKAKDDEITRMREQLRQTQVCLDDLTGTNDPHDDIKRLPPDEAKKRLVATQFRVSQLQEELAYLNEKVEESIGAEKKLKETNANLEADIIVMSSDLETKKEAERTLNQSLKEAVDILKPLQGHVMTVEKEKAALLHRLKTAERHIEELESSPNRAITQSLSPGRNVERTIRRLEEEKELLEQRVHQLERDAADADQRTLGSVMTQDVQRLQEQLADVQKRHENTKKMLDQSAKTNASLLQDLKEMEDEDEEAQEQIASLEQKLIEKDRELAAAKHIATTAMVKVDSMSVHSSVVGESQDTIARLQEELKRAKQKNDRLVASIRQRDQQIVGSSADSASGRGSATPVASEANTDVGIYHMNELGFQQSGGQESGAGRRWRGDSVVRDNF